MPKRGRKTSFAEISSMILAHGLDGVKKMDPHATKFSVLRSIHHLSDMGKSDHAATLWAWMKKKWPDAARRKKAAVGDVRIYRSARDKKAFLVRVPVDSMGVGKGTLTRARFMKCKDLYGHPRNCPNCPDENKACLVILEPLPETESVHAQQLKKRPKRRRAPVHFSGTAT